MSLPTATVSVVSTLSSCRSRLTGCDGALLIRESKSPMQKPLREEINDTVVRYLEHKLQTGGPAERGRYGPRNGAEHR